MTVHADVFQSAWDNPDLVYAPALTSWERDGVVILRGFFSSGLVAAINHLIDQLWLNRHTLHSNLCIDTFLEHPQQSRMHLRNTPDNAREHSYKINDLYLESSLVRSVVLDSRLQAILASLLGGPALLTNTINFEYGSEQPEHVDTLFVRTPNPQRMAACWLALEDVSSRNGPLVYYPGSHKIPPFPARKGGLRIEADEMPAFHDYMKTKLQERRLQPKEFTAAAGDLLIWHAQLLHGGRPIVDSHSTRKSLVSHFCCRKDYWHHAWRLRRGPTGGYYYKRPHQRIP